MKRFLLFIIKMYQVFVSHIVLQMTGARCRFPITCSEYAKEQISKKGAVKGSGLAIKRILSCQPYSAQSVIRTAN